MGEFYVPTNRTNWDFLAEGPSSPTAANRMDRAVEDLYAEAMQYLAAFPPTGPANGVLSNARRTIYRETARVCNQAKPGGNRKARRAAKAWKKP